MREATNTVSLYDQLLCAYIDENSDALLSGHQAGRVRLLERKDEMLKVAVAIEGDEASSLYLTINEEDMVTWLLAKIRERRAMSPQTL